MLTQEQTVEIRVMARRGESVRSIARELGCSRNTVRRYLRGEQAERYGPRAVRACKLDGYKAYLQAVFVKIVGAWSTEDCYAARFSFSCLLSQT